MSDTHKPMTWMRIIVYANERGREGGGTQKGGTRGTRGTKERKEPVGGEANQKQGDTQKERQRGS